MSETPWRLIATQNTRARVPLWNAVIPVDEYHAIREAALDARGMVTVQQRQTNGTIHLLARPARDNAPQTPFAVAKALQPTKPRFVPTAAPPWRWTPERDSLAKTMWITGARNYHILARVNALPGPEITSTKAITSHAQYSGWGQRGREPSTLTP